MAIQPMRYTYYDGAKAVTLSDLDNFLDYLVAGQGGAGSVTVESVINSVAFVFRGVRLRAQAVASLPYTITRKGTDDVVDNESDYDNVMGFWADPFRTLWQLEESLTALGKAYLFKARNRVVLKELRYLHPDTVTPVLDGKDGLTGFERQVNSVTYKFKADEIAYFWHPDYSVEVGPPSRSPVKAALAAAGVMYNLDAFMEAFFGRGAIKGLIFAAKGMPNKEERGRLTDWFKRTFGRGVKSAFETGVFNADEIQVVPVGEGLEAISNNVIAEEMRQSIAVALGIPITLMNSNTASGLGGGGVADRDDIHFYTKTVKPEADFIARVLNSQVLHDVGYHFAFDYNQLDVFQEDEKERANSFALYVQAGMKPEVAATMVGLEIPDPAQIEPHYAEAFKQPQPVPPQLQEAQEELEQPDIEEQSEEDREEEREQQEESRAADLERWMRKAIKRIEEGKPEKAAEFESPRIPSTLKAAIEGALMECKDSDDVRAAFANAIAWGVYP